MTAKIVAYKDYVAGWLDSSIHGFLHLLSPEAPETKYALITCLDSNRNPAGLRHTSPELKSLANRFQVVGHGLLLPTEALQEVDARKQVFFGFDEVWFCPDSNIQPKPEQASLVGPARLDRSRIRRFGKWMSTSSCYLAIGDGEGLNFIVRASGLARLLVGHSLGQPSPSLPPPQTDDADSSSWHSRRKAVSAG